MKLFTQGALLIRTVQEPDGPILARIGVQDRRRDKVEDGYTGTRYEDLTHYQAIELAAALFGFGMSRDAGAHLAAVMADFQALMVKHTGKPVDIAPMAPKSTEGH